MSTKHLLAKELHPIIDAVPSVDITDELLPRIREQSAMRGGLADAEAVGVTRREVTIPAYPGATDTQEVRCLLYTPDNPESNRPGYVHIHGGGYIMGSPEGSDIGNLAVCSKLGVVVLSVDYRLAPEHPIPAPLDDCYSGLAHMHSQASDLGVDTNRIGVGGESAGGGLAAALAIMARDKGEYSVCHQHLTYPMLDNLTGDAEHPGDPLVGEFVWTRQRNQYGWKSYLGKAPAQAPQVPARVEDYAGLPGTWMFTADLDLFRDENIDYARSLMRAGVSVDLEVFSGACHGFQMLPGTHLGRRYITAHMEALERGLGVA
ncbi:MAG: alpha/beta hydrolase fold domain-containing protein [Pseudomonadota bacterium]